MQASSVERPVAIKVCIDCIMFVANNESPLYADDGVTFKTEEEDQAWIDALPDYLVTLGDIDDDEQYSFHTSSCEYCGSGLAGSRFSATAWIAEPSTLHFHAGHNLPGYLPDADEPDISLSWEDARQSMIADLDHYWWTAVDDYSETGRQLLGKVSTEIRELSFYVTGPEWSAHIGNEVYWIIQCVEADCMTEVQS